ncbi:MAG: diguanylate cyclase, partial [Candidatus Omnitrophica bacterium]|nr:diguanylate cyclase [Candidatus Omnitrophota bacterium]
MMDKELYSVLVVDPHPETSLLFKKSFHAGSVFPAEVDSAATVHEAVEKVKTHSYDLLLIEADLHQGDASSSLLACVETFDFPIPLILMLPVHDDQMFRAAKRMGITHLLVMSENHFDDLALKIKTMYEDTQAQDTADSSFEATFPEELKFDFGDMPKPTEIVQPGPMLDELTGIYTHSYFQQRVVEEFSRSTRYKYSVSCIFIDIDRFKAVN